MKTENSDSRGYSVEAIRDFYQNSPFDFGAGDIFSFGPFKTLEVVADLMFIFSMVKNHAGKNPISQFTVILPPASEYTTDDVRNTFADAVARHRGRSLEERELEILSRRLRIVEAADLQARTVMALIENAMRNSVVIICGGARYRKEELPQLPPGEKTIGLQEDMWVPQLHSLAVGAIAAAKQNELYIALCTGRWRPRRQANLDLLMSIDNCGLMTAESENDPDSVLAEHADQWFAEIAKGRIGSVLSSIDALPEAMNGHKAGLKIQAFHRAGLLPQTVELVRAELNSGRNLSPEGRVKLALIAAEAGAHGLASEALGPAIGALNVQELLEPALTIAANLGETSLEDQCATRLERMFPDSRHLQRHRLIALFRKRDYASVAAMLAAPLAGIGSDDAAFYARLADGLSTQDKPNYQSILSEVADRCSGHLAWARLMCIRDADARGLFEEALELAMYVELTGALAKQLTWALLHAVEQLLIRRNKDGELGIDPSNLGEPIMRVVRYLAHNPADGETRVALAKLLSAQVTGSYGLPVIAAAMLKLAQETPVPLAQNLVTQQGAVGESDFDDIAPFVVGAMQWLAQQSIVIPGRTVLPETLITAPADRLIFILARMIEYVGHGLRDGSDVNYLKKRSNFKLLAEVAEPELQLASDLGSAPCARGPPPGQLLNISQRLVHGLR